MTDQCTTKGFADFAVEQRGYAHTFLDKVDTLIEWDRIEKVLMKKYRKTASADGRPAYPALPMFKLLLLQRWYNLSDPGLEEAVKDRISFIRFSGFSLASTLPDHSTICRFRNTLLALRLYDLLFEEINCQIETKGLLVREGAIVDAAIVESSRRPRKVIEVMPEDRKEEEASAPHTSYSADTDATWIKKGMRPYYGYKAHITVDAKESFILGGHITPAHVADTTELTHLLNDAKIPEGAFVLADKGYASEKNRNILTERTCTDGIMHKAARGRPLTPLQRFINHLISSQRYKVERCIGTLKRGYHFFRMRYLGLKKGQMELTMTAMAYNLKKAVLLST
jgi:transposase, IS5 family